MFANTGVVAKKKSGSDRLETTVKEKAANTGITRMYGSTYNMVKD